MILSDLNDLSTIAKLELSDKSARAIAVHPNGEEVAIGFSDHTIKIISTEDWRLKKKSWHMIIQCSHYNILMMVIYY